MGEMWVVLVVQVAEVARRLLVALETLLQQVLLKDNLEETAPTVQDQEEVVVQYALEKHVPLVLVMVVMEVKLQFQQLQLITLVAVEVLEVADVEADVEVVVLDQVLQEQLIQVVEAEVEIPLLHSLVELVVAE